MISGTFSSCEHLASQDISLSDPSRGHLRPTPSPHGESRQPATPFQRLGDGVSVVPRMTWYLMLKRFGDILLAATLLVVFTPVVILAAVLIKLTSRGPAFYSQVRVGCGGRHFTLLKLRTMRHDAEAGTGPVWSTENDCRVTVVGKLLRKSHIDEFPQLLNVLRGQMSLVGPRPERPEFVTRLEAQIPFYRERLKVRPGITGMAQLRLPPDATLECVRRKVMHDVYYVSRVNPLLDLKLLILTAWRLVVELAGFGWRCMTLPSSDDVEHGFQLALGIEADEPAVAPLTIAAAPSGSQLAGGTCRTG